MQPTRLRAASRCRPPTPTPDGARWRRAAPNGCSDAAAVVGDHGRAARTESSCASPAFGGLLSVAMNIASPVMSIAAPHRVVPRRAQWHNAVQRRRAIRGTPDAAMEAHRGTHTHTHTPTGGLRRRHSPATPCECALKIERMGTPFFAFHTMTIESSPSAHWHRPPARTSRRWATPSTA